MTLHAAARDPVEPILLSVTQVSTFLGPLLQTRATGFFFRRAERLFLVTSRHVLFDEPSEHRPDRLTLEIHVNRDNLAQSVSHPVALYANARAVWRQGRDAGGEIDVATLELDPDSLPEGAMINPLGPADLISARDAVVIGSPLSVLAFPLSFHDTLHHLPVARSASLASSFGLRFQGQGFFLTDARLHRGASGAPVLQYTGGGSRRTPRPWKLLGIHSSRMDMGGRDADQDEALGLNVTWYADILLTLTR